MADEQRLEFETTSGEVEPSSISLRWLRGLEWLSRPYEYELELEVDQASGNILKRLEFALSGKLMRRSLYPKWLKITDPTSKEVWYAEQIYFYDEVEKGNESVIKIKTVDLSALEANMFTKAWLESKSR